MQQPPTVSSAPRRLYDWTALNYSNSITSHIDILLTSVRPMKFRRRDALRQLKNSSIQDLLRSRRWCEGTPALYFAPHTAPKCHVRHTIYTYSLHFQTAPASSSSLCWKVSGLVWLYMYAMHREES
ncbi:uncharacterized protein LOC107272826 isoform X2 [Cephus cinctus]|uniref:Uncharacterized protein LOC107272826 isoform X2 n=1 Tax=Cephus cinctus TaxID=211228 RepID=A0AAJ7CBC9_CEPCN|nr:uncharacterized protein LOC107272826 isoform X2 [Cephus cinctus]